MDWFVPVVYSSVADSVIEINPPVAPQSNPPLIGRDFDVLRFERSLIQNHPLYLYGPRASGKSSLFGMCRVCGKKRLVFRRFSI